MESTTPVASVLATVASLETSRDLTEALRQEITSIGGNVELEGRLIDDMLDWTRIGHGMLELHREIVDVNAIIRSSLEMCQLNVDGKNLEVSMALRAGSPRVWGDPIRLRQVFCSLIDNAVAFTSAEGCIRIRSADVGAGRLLIEVADTGAGTATEHMQRIFDDFEQGNRNVSPAPTGLRLRLLLARILVELHGGSLSAASTDNGHGSVFRVVLENFAPLSDQRPRSDLGPRDSLKILLVDDNVVTLRAMTLMLHAAGFAVETATNVSDGIAKLSSERFNLLISDIGLPDGSGLEIMRYGRDHFGLHGIAFSGYATPEDAEESKAAGFAHHVAKPARVDNLIDLIKRTAA